MIGEHSREAPRKDQRRRLLLLPLLLVPFALGGITALWWRGASDAGSPGTSAVPSATSSQSGESPGASQIVPTPTPVPTAAPTPAPTPSPVPTPAPPVSGAGHGVVRVGDGGFTITGSVSNLALGVATPIRLTLTNPNGVPVYVTALTVNVSADSTPPGCSSASNLHLTQSNASAADPIVIAARGSVTLASVPRAPQITLLNLPGVNQDICKGKSFGLTYSGSAHS